MPVAIARENVASLFSVIIEISHDLTIRSASDLILKYAPEVQVGSKLTEVFEFVRPRKLQQPLQESNAIHLMISKQSHYAIRGQIIAVKLSTDEDGHLLLGAPWLSRLVNDGIHGYDFQDFPAHDAQLDWLFMLSAEQQQVKDLQRLSAELKDAKSEAERINASKSAFFTVMSHEMRTPLNAIVGVLNLLEDQELNLRQRELVDMGVSASDHLMSVINDVLDLSKIDVGKMEVDMVSFSLESMLEDVRSISQSRALTRGLFFEINVSGNTPAVVKGDVAKLKRVLINLVGNAIKFTNKGGVEIFVDTYTNDLQQPVLCFRVDDTGMGISDDEVSKLFDDFWSSRREGEYIEGTGLGLGISRRLVELMKGSITVKSIEGEGSSFNFEVPVELASVSDMETLGDEVNNTKQVSGMNLDGKVLLVEDNRANQLIGRLNLEQMGLRVDVAMNGKEATAATAKQAYDVVLMDLGMPVMDGFEATSVIRAQPGNETLPIIACTAHAYSDKEPELTAAGFSGYVSKPLSRAQLGSALSQWLEEATLSPAPDVIMQTTALLHTKMLEQLLADVGEQNAPALIEMFEVELETRLKELRLAVGANDLSGLRHHAHALKSSAYNYGAGQLGDELNEVERRATQADPSAFELIPALEEQCVHSLAALKAFFEQR